MKYNPNESYEVWADRVRQFENGEALKRIARGEDPNVVIEQMSRRIMEKLLHPILKAIKDSPPAYTPEDLEKSKQHYIETYINKIPLRYEQMDGNFFDKPE